MEEDSGDSGDSVTPEELGDRRGRGAGPRIDDRVVIVTGSGGGIGSAIVRRLGEVGATVIAHVRRDSGTSLDGAALIVETDLRSSSAPDTIIGQATDAFGRIDGLVNCAGIQPVAEFISITDEQWSEMIDVNLTAAHRITAAVAQRMIGAGHPGSIVHVSSIEGTSPALGHSHYAVAKAGLIMHARSAALELGPAGIRVNSVSPGLIDRPGLCEQWPDGVERWIDNAPLGRVGTGEDVADACLFLLSDMARWITGVDLAVDGGMSASPSW